MNSLGIHMNNIKHTEFHKHENPGLKQQRWTLWAGADTGRDAGDASPQPDLKRYWHDTWFH